MTLPCRAESAYINPDTGYRVVVEDDAELLSEAELSSLSDEMRQITEYGNVLFKTTNENPSYGSSATSQYAKSALENEFGTSVSATIFLIDMDQREIYIYSTGAINKIVTKSKAITITDNVYTYASRQDYYGCASNAFHQMATILDGGRIAQPMKYGSNLLLALTLAMIINYIIVKAVSRSKKPDRNELLEGAFTQCKVHNPKAVMTRKNKVYDPPSSSGGSSGSSSSGSSFSGGGGGGSSHSSGSGGGHRF